MKENATKVLERIIVFSTITSFILSAMLIFSSIIDANSKIEENYISLFTCVLTLISGFVYVLALQIFVNEKTKFGAHIIFLVFYIIFELFISFICGAYNAPYVLIPVTIVHYLLEAFLNEIFVFHDYFIFENGERHGKELIEYLFHNNFAASDFALRRKKVQGYLFLISFVMIVLIILAYIIGNGMTLINSLLVLVFYFFIFINFWILGYFNRESYYAFLGFNDISQELKSNFKYCLLFFLIASLFGFLVSSNKAIIKIDKVAEKTEKVYYDFSEPEYTAPEYDFNFDYDIKGQLQKEEAKELNIPLDLIFKILKIIALTFAIAGFLFFLIRPFFTDDWKNYWKERKFTKFMHRIFDGLRDLFNFIFKGNKSSSEYAKVDSKTFKSKIEEFLKKSKRSKVKRDEVDRLTKRFMLLIEWASAREIRYTNNLAPMEFCNMIKTYFSTFEDKSLIKNTDDTAFLFEKALYDKDLLSKDEEKLYNDSIDLILSSGYKK